MVQRFWRGQGVLNDKWEDRKRWKKKKWQHSVYLLVCTCPAPFLQCARNPVILDVSYNATLLALFHPKTSHLIRMLFFSYFLCLHLILQLLNFLFQVVETRRQIGILESYLEQRGVSLPEGFFSCKVVCPNPNFRYDSESSTRVCLVTLWWRGIIFLLCWLWLIDGHIFAYSEHNWYKLFYWSVISRVSKFWVLCSFSWVNFSLRELIEKELTLGIWFFSLISRLRIMFLYSTFIIIVLYVSFLPDPLVIKMNMQRSIVFW